MKSILKGIGWIIFATGMALMFAAAFQEPQLFLMVLGAGIFLAFIGALFVFISVGRGGDSDG